MDDDADGGPDVHLIAPASQSQHTDNAELSEKADGPESRPHGLARVIRRHRRKLSVIGKFRMDARAWRTVNVFVSSTFRDFVQERTQLTHKTLAALDAWCRERLIRIHLIDLRWGVTEEQVQTGEVVPICLREVVRSFPYFVGMYGERYGWCPPVTAAWASQFPFLHKYNDRSVTEWETVLGALDVPINKHRALIYFRDEAFINTQPEAVWPDLVAESEAHARRMKSMKERLRSKFVVTRYMWPQHLGTLVLEDLKKLLAKDFPGFGPTEAELDEAAHGDYERLLTKTYIDVGLASQVRQQIQRGRSVLVTGGAGSGKSALLSHLCKTLRVPGLRLFYHSRQASWAARTVADCLERLASFLHTKLVPASEAEVLAGNLAVLHEPEQLLEFVERLMASYLGADSSKLLLVIDGVDELDEQGRLDWLPRPHAAMRFLCSATAGSAAVAELAARKWHVLPLAGTFSADAGATLVKQHLAEAGKTASRTQLQTLAEFGARTTPQLMLAVLDEMQLFGFESVTGRMDELCRISDFGTMLQQILGRMESEYMRASRTQTMASFFQVHTQFYYYCFSYCSCHELVLVLQVCYRLLLRSCMNINSYCNSHWYYLFA